MSSRRAVTFGLISTTAIWASKPILAQQGAVEVARIKNVVVMQANDGRVFWTSEAAVDADGSNGQRGNGFAYRSDDRGLDAVANAGWPRGAWRNVLLDNGSGVPRDDGHGNWYSKTTYVWRGSPSQPAMLMRPRYLMS